MMNDALLPIVDEVNAPFWEGCREGVLRVQQCSDTGRLLFPPRQVNSWSPRAPMTWRDLSGRGSIWSVIEPHPPLMLHFTELAPYNAIVVSLEEDAAIRLVGNLVSAPGGAINQITYDDIAIGDAVEVVFDRVSDEITLPRWVLSG